jgi:hypothetical protein
MPRIPINYEKTIIYKIVCNNLSVTETYVGHTTDFVQRKKTHKSCCSSERSQKSQRKIYKFIRENEGWTNFSMIEIEKYPCKNVMEAVIRERFYYELLNSSLNMNYPQRNQKEYQETNKDKIAMYQKKYFENNRDKITVYQKKYVENNKDKEIMKDKEYYILNKDRILLTTKTYRENNKEKISIRNKEYRENNKEKINIRCKEYSRENKEKRTEYLKKYKESNLEEIKEKRSKRYICECGKELLCIGKSRHLKSKIHKISDEDS